MVQRNGKQDKHIKKRVAKAVSVMGVSVWGIGKRRFGKNWRRKIWLFDRLVMVGHGIEIWRWKEREAVERLQDYRDFSKMGLGGGRENTEVLIKRGTAKRIDEEGREKSVGI